MSRLDITDINQRVDMDALQVLGDFILLEVIERGMSAGGFYLPKGEQTSSRYGKVLRVGSGEVNPVTGEVYPLDFKPGEILLFMEYAGDRLYVGGKKYRMIRAHGIWAKVEMDLTQPHRPITSVTPITDHVVIKFPKTEKSLSGILDIPGDIQTKCRLGEVLDVGPGLRNMKGGHIVATVVKPGDKVIVLRYSGASLMLPDGEVRLANEGDIHAVYEGNVDVMNPGDHPAVDQPFEDERKSRLALEEYAQRGLIGKDMIR